MSLDFIPNPDALFNNWINNLTTYANANLAALGLVAGDLTPITTALSTWTTNYNKHLAAQTAALAARADKDAARASLETLVRALVRRLQASPAVSDAERLSLGITVPDPTATPPGPPTGKPLLKVECDRLMHTVKWTDSSTPTKKAKPPGVLGLELRRALTAIGAPTPTDPDAFVFLALDTATPNVVEFDAADGGKNAHYVGRWVNSANEHGVWSETVSVTVGV